MEPSRRDFLRKAAVLAPALALPAGLRAEEAPRPRLRIGVSTYSFWHFKGPRVEVEDCIDRAAEMGFDGVEILHRQMESEDKGYLQRLKRRAFVNARRFRSWRYAFDSPDI